MARSVFNSWAVDAATGQPVGGAVVSVTTPLGIPIALYDARVGGSSLGNPYTTELSGDNAGKITFYAEPQRVNIVVTRSAVDSSVVAEFNDHLLISDDLQDQISERVKFLDSIADLTALTGMADGQTFIVNSGDDAGVYKYDASGSGSASFWNVVPDTAPGRFIKAKSDSGRVLFNAAETELGDALESVRSVGSSNTSSISALDTEYTVTKDRLRSGKFAAPAGLTWNPPLSVFSTSMGEIRTDFDAANYKYTGNQAYCWINPLAADNSGDGQSPATAKRDLSLVLGSSTTYGTIYIVPGALIDRDSTKGWGGALTASKNIICPGGRAKITRRFAPVSWTSLGSGEYSCARSGVKFCWDATQYDELGDYVIMTKYATTGELTAAASGWWTDGTDLRVKREDLAEPTLASTAIFLQEGTGNGSAIINGNVHFYTEGIDYEGGYSPLYAKATAGGQNLQVHSKNCTFKYSYLQDGVSTINARLTTSQNCRAARNVKDGFNYHADLYSEQCYFIEVDCSAAQNGIDQEAEPYENNRNASTAHDDIIGVRVNTVGHDTHGPIIADVDGAFTWNIGCTAHNSQGEAEDQQCNYIVTTGAKMWLDRCSGHSSPEGVVVGSSSYIYTRNCELEGDNTIIGTFTSY